jgi:transcriptional regulator with XRE-family HTH domain
MISANKVTIQRERIVTSIKTISNDVGSNKKLIEMISISEPSFYKILKGAKDLRLIAAFEICNATGTAITWLATGEGHKYNNLVDVENAEKPMGTTPATQGTVLDGISVRLTGAMIKLGGVDKTAAKVGISSSQMQRYTKKDMDIKVITLLSIAEVTGLSFKWLATGKGSPTAPGTAVKAKEQPEATLKPRDTVTLDELRDSLEKGEEVWNKASEVADIQLPVALEDNIKGMIIDYQMEPMAVVKLLLTIKRTMVAKP